MAVQLKDAQSEFCIPVMAEDKTEASTGTDRLSGGADLLRQDAIREGIARHRGRTSRKVSPPLGRPIDFNSADNDTGRVIPAGRL